MIAIKNTRFGTIEVADDTVISFGNGLLGFPDEKQFVLVERNGDLGYLQSVNTPWLAFAVMDAALLAPAYPVPSGAKIAKDAGLAGDATAMLLMVVNDEQQERLDINLLAPLVVDVDTRTGAQVLLDPQRYRTPLALPTNHPAATSTASLMSAR